MLIVSWNVHGSGSRVTRRAVRRCVLKEKPDILFIQETKLKSVDDWLRKSLWVKSSANSLVTSMGASGEILSIWNK